MLACWIHSYEEYVPLKKRRQLEEQDRLSRLGKVRLTPDALLCHASVRLPMQVRQLQGHGWIETKRLLGKGKVGQGPEGPAYGGSGKNYCVKIRCKCNTYWVVCVDLWGQEFPGKASLFSSTRRCKYLEKLFFILISAVVFDT